MPFSAIVCYYQHLRAFFGKRVRTSSQLCTGKKTDKKEKKRKQIKINERKFRIRTTTNNHIRTLSGQIEVKTKNENLKTKNMEKKTSIIGIPQCVASHTLKCLNENNISCQYEGVDQAGRLLMRLNYLSDQDGYLKELISEMEEDEKSFTTLLEIATLIFLNEISKVKAALELAQLKKKHGNKQN